MSSSKLIWLSKVILSSLKWFARGRDQPGTSMEVNLQSIAVVDWWKAYCFSFSQTWNCTNVKNQLLREKTAPATA
jgi:hypothetical protein